MTEMTYLEYGEMVNKNNYESYTQEQIQEFSRDILKSMDSHERTMGAIDFASLTAVEVREKDLSKSLMYFREQQIAWDKSEDGTFMKARAGVYKDTPTNRKKGLVGTRYGADKEKVAKEAARRAEQERDEKEEADRYDKMSDEEKRAEYDRKEKEGETRNDKLNRKYED